MGRQEQMSRSWLAGLCALALWTSPAAAVELLVVGGQGQGQDWAAAAGVAPVIDFDSRPGWIMPRSVAEGTNVALDTYARGGLVTSPNAQTVLRLSKDELARRLRGMIDDNHQTAFEAKDVAATGILIIIDLGARFGVNQIRFFPRPDFRTDFMKGYVLSVNDGLFGADIVAASPDKLPNKSLFTITAQDGSNNRDTVDVRFPLQYVRYIRLESTQRFNWEVDEIQVFGQGFVPEAQYLSQVFDLAQPALWGKLRWAAEPVGRPEKSRMILRTRSGSSASPETDPTAWSPWSPPYAENDMQILSPSPRRYIQFSLDFESDGLTDGLAMDSLAFEFSRPALATSILGEVWPQEVPVGVDTAFTYAVRVMGGRGFDQLEIDTPAPVTRVEALRLDGRDLAFTAQPHERGLRLEFARQSGDHTLEAVFETAVLRYETVFTGRLRDLQTESLPQAVEGGEAADSLPGDDLSVRVPIGGELIHRLAVGPNPFSPNGDGINDRATITYDIVNLTEAVPVGLVIYDLGGNRVAEVPAAPGQSGRHLLAWDGRDEGGQLLPPGIYVVQLEVETDSGTKRRSSTVAIAY